MGVATNFPTFQNHVLKILIKAAPWGKEFILHSFGHNPRK